jgi:hypothetical protein
MPDVSWNRCGRIACCAVAALPLLGNIGCRSREPLGSRTGNAPLAAGNTPDAQRGPGTAEGGTRPQPADDRRTGLWKLDDSATRMVFDQELPGARPADIVRELNKRYPAPGIVLRKVTKSAVVVEVKDDEMLTQRMGSTGAQAYLATVTYSLTSVPGIQSVEFHFTPGDHASPGKYTRRAFRDLFR